MNLAEGILSTAQAIGANPLDLATVISYETGGTFDPLQLGPVTQHGQHRGLIQFGEPQAAQYGVNWADPLGSQLGPNGAVANYLRGSGYQPGMGLLDLYSTINAGAPGRYNASDANNGGAPGTVADKVNEQMAGHRRNAEQLLGQMMAGQQGQPMQQQPGGLLATTSTMNAPQEPSIWDAIAGRLPEPIGNRLRDPDWRARMGIALAGMSHRPNQGVIETLQSGIDTRADDRRLNQTLEWLMMQPGAESYVAMAQATGNPAAAAAAYMDYTQQQNDPLRQAQLEQMQLQNEALRNPSTEMDPVVVGNEIVDRNSGTVIYSADTSAGFRLTTPEEEAQYGGPGQIGPDGRFYPLESNDNGITIQGPDGTITQIGGSGRPLTEGQARDNVYATRAQGALETLNGVTTDGTPRDSILTSRGNQIAGAVPFGLGGSFQDPEYQVVQQAGQEFLQAILRKDTGAAITAEEERLYGQVYLPQPGNSPELLEAKRQARIRAIEAIKSGMSPLQQLQTDQALLRSGGGIATTPLPPSSSEINGALGISPGVQSLLDQYAPVP